MQIDPQLIQEARQGQRKAQQALYEQCFAPLMALCLRYHHNRDDALAVLNLGFLKILANLGRYAPPVPFIAWIKRIMLNTIIDDYRKQHHERAHMQYTDFSAQPLAQSGPLDWNEADLRFDAAQLRAMIATLPPMSAKVFNLFAIDGFSHQDISEALGISVGTSKWHLSSARERLRQLLQKELEPSKSLGHAPTSDR